MARAKQAEIPMEGEGVEPQKRIGAIDDAADEYVDMRDKRMTLTEKEVQCRQKVIDLMKRHGYTRYAYDGHVVELETDDKLKVKKAKEAKAD